MFTAGLVPASPTAASTSTAVPGATVTQRPPVRRPPPQPTNPPRVCAACLSLFSLVLLLL